MSKVLLLTAAVIPKYSKEVIRKDMDARVNDYSQTLLKWYNSQQFDRIVFCDNSGLPKDSLKATLVQGSKGLSDIIDSIEFLTYEDNPDFRYHYGYSELGLIDYAIKNSKTLQDSRFFTKCTGRLYYPNYHKLENVIHEELKFCVDARSNFLWIKNQQVTTQLMIFNTKFYIDNLLNIKEEMTTEEYYIEHFFYRKLIPFKNDRSCCFRWPIELLPQGIAAHSNKSYLSRKKQTFSMIRGIVRYIFPKLWI